jgi:hypothetical protein
MTVEKTPKRKTAQPKVKSVSKSKMITVPSVGSASVETDYAAVDTLSAPVDRQLMIEREAYLRAERRGFEPGHELEDWLAAEHSLGALGSA